MEPASVYGKYDIVVLLGVFFVLVYPFHFSPLWTHNMGALSALTGLGFRVHSCCAPMYLWASHLDGKIDTWFSG